MSTQIDWWDAEPEPEKQQDVDDTAYREFVDPYIDKASWPDGPWKTESDRVEFVSFGLPCLAKRSQTSGNWLGYVAVPHTALPEGKPVLYEKLSDMEVHGGLTWNSTAGNTFRRTFTDLWHPLTVPGITGGEWEWYGFDCAHSGDLMPRLQPFAFAARKQQYRALPYVLLEIQSLAKQLKTYFKL